MNKEPELSERERRDYIDRYSADCPGLGARSPELLTFLQRVRVQRVARDDQHAETTTVHGLPTRTKAIIDAGLEGRAVIRAVHEWHRSVVPGCIVIGPGEGKTVACASLLHGRRSVLEGRQRGVFTTESTLIGALMAGYQADERMKRFVADLLVVDFCGVGSAFGNSSYQASMDWCRERIESGKRTILTYKGSEQEFAMRYGQALSGSMMRICTIVEAR